MATVPTVTVGGTDQTDFIQHKTLYWKLKSLDFTLVDPADNPSLHDVVSVDEPEWHGRVSTIESHPFRSANGDDHRLVQVTCTNKHVAVADTAPFGISDTPNLSTTFPYKDLAYIQTLADQTDLSTAEYRLTATVYEPGLLPGQTVEVTSVAEGLSATDFIITEMQTVWLRSDAPEYHIEASVDGVPPITLGGIIEQAGCDCPPFNQADCVDAIAEFSCLARDANTYSYTEGGTRSGIGPGILEMDGNYHYTTTDFTAYFRSGGPSVSGYPTAGEDTEMGNGGAASCIFTDGTFDYLPGGSAQFVRIRVIGPGLLTIHSIAHPGGLDEGISHCTTATTLNVQASVAGGASGIASTSGPIGIALDITVPDTEGECAYYIDMWADGSWGYGGSNWTPHAEAELCHPDPGQPIVPEHFTGDGVTDTFTLAWPYMPGSLEVLVEGVDWSDQVIEDDATAGDFSLAYPPPAASDPEPNVEVHYRYPK